MCWICAVLDQTPCDQPYQQKLASDKGLMVMWMHDLLRKHPLYRSRSSRQ